MEFVRSSHQEYPYRFSARFVFCVLRILLAKKVDVLRGEDV